MLPPPTRPLTISRAQYEDIATLLEQAARHTRALTAIQSRLGAMLGLADDDGSATKQLDVICEQVYEEDVPGPRSRAERLVRSLGLAVGHGAS
jgi:hypothetical protein